MSIFYLFNLTILMSDLDREREREFSLLFNIIKYHLFQMFTLIIELKCTTIKTFSTEISD